MNNDKSPLVSVLLPVYNAEKYLHDAMKSILTQTYSNFEVVVIDDGSSDGSTTIIKTYAEEDKRIRPVFNNHDFIDSLNIGLSECRGKYVARMDADDRMKPGRLCAQVEVMENNPDVAFCSSYMQRMGAEDICNVDLSGEVKNLPITLLLGNIISHPTVMLRREFLDKHNLKYPRGYDYAEDYKLWTEVSLIGGKLFIIPEPLLEYRISENQASCIHQEEQYDSALKIKNELLQTILNSNGIRRKKVFFELYRLLSDMNEQNLLTPEEIFVMFYSVLNRYCEISQH